MFKSRIEELKNRLEEACIDVALITDDDSVYYYTGYYDYLHMEFGRPTILMVTTEGKSLLITPSIDLNMALENAMVDQIVAWNDGEGNEWRECIPENLQSASRLAIEPQHIPPVVRTYIDSIVDANRLADVAPIISDMRMIKSAGELQLARHTGEVANAMMNAGREAIAAGVVEFEVALAAAAAGTRKSSALLAKHYAGSRMSPNIHFLQIMASGEDIVKTHHRASNRVMNVGEPVFLCFCGMTNFHRFKLGFDRTFWIGEIKDKSQEAVYQVAVDSQAAALEMLRPGVKAEQVHQAYAEVIQGAGYDFPFRCGRGTGFSFLEQPQLVFGDETVLQPNMVFAVDGSVSTKDFRAQVGDSYILTEDGYEAITSHPKTIPDVIIQ